MIYIFITVTSDCEIPEKIFQKRWRCGRTFELITEVILFHHEKRKSQDRWVSTS